MKNQWAEPDGELGRYIREESEKTLQAYSEQPSLVDEHANLEADTARGGYAHRQLLELVQNSADALAGKDDGRILIHLDQRYLYCADNGKAIDDKGVKALMFSHLSPKRGRGEIGKFGLGFKSVLGVSDNPEFFSRAGSFTFDRRRSSERIRQVVPDARRYPVLRLPSPVDPRGSSDSDHVLRELMDWATNIVRLPLNPHAYSDLAGQMDEFPPEFLLFVEHVEQLTLVRSTTGDNESKRERKLEMKKVSSECHLVDDDKTTRWKLFNDLCLLSDEARADQRETDECDGAQVWWAAPLDESSVADFWAFFPTRTASLLTGILNAPWKTNEDRQNLLPGPYNDELIRFAAKMVAEAVPQLSTGKDPARHLGLLPRRREKGDPEQSILLRDELDSNLRKLKIVPDQTGELRPIDEIRYPPETLAGNQECREALERWADCPGRPENWLHHSALQTRHRIAVINKLREPAGSADVAEWLQALTSNKALTAVRVECSRAAINTAAAIPREIRQKARLGKIVLGTDGHWHEPDPNYLFLRGESSDPNNKFVHSELESDDGTRSALAELGLKPPSVETSFRKIAKMVLAGPRKAEASFLEEFWRLARQLESGAAVAIINQSRTQDSIKRGRPFIRTRYGDWQTPESVLLPGKIVPADGSRDSAFSVDPGFHQPDEELLLKIGASSEPNDRNLSSEKSFSQYQNDCRSRFTEQRKSRSKPRWDSLIFQSTKGAGPLEVLSVLSEEGKARYTEALLLLDSTYRDWTMKHKTQTELYSTMSFESPTVKALREHGRIRTREGIVSFSEALGSNPKNPEALETLLKHPKAEQIKKAFGLMEPIPEFIGEEDPVPLIDAWPGLGQFLPPHLKECKVVYCEQIVVGNDAGKKCVFHSPDVYMVDESKGHDELKAVLRELGLDDLNDQQIDGIVDYEPRPDIEDERAAIRKLPTDAERLLKAVGAANLRSELSALLLDIVESEKGSRLTGLDIAEAAIATWDSGALRQYRRALDHLEPPGKWAGSPRALGFVRSLGFSDEWAGERNRKRAPFEEIEGRYSLPELHDFQQRVVHNVRAMLRRETNSVENRGMISMPTGSGKTRVAVQSIVESMRDDDLNGGVLWVADRDELCEQAVESWRQVWSGIGAHARVLRVSRMWANQPPPQTTSDFHVVVATIQTLHSRFERSDEHQFLKHFKLIVFDEAHRSIAPTFTSVMHEIGLTHRRQGSEPFLLGLTATPYRGYNEDETRWLANRYGQNRLDHGAFASNVSQDVIAELQDMEVLAQADHKIIEGGEFFLNASERTEAERYTGWLPQSVEDRIAKNQQRTRNIIKAFEEHVEPGWPTLVFATSVDHAQTIAVLLARKGFKSRTVSGKTEPVLRRRIVREFRSGDIQVLTNYGVFREGFDAPKTRAIIVARPVFSPNLYFQMIGRGLRGTMNGGNDRCLVLDVRDNIRNHNKALAFSKLDWLWDRSPKARRAGR